MSSENSVAKSGQKDSLAPHDTNNEQSRRRDFRATFVDHDAGDIRVSARILLRRASCLEAYEQLYFLLH